MEVVSGAALPPPQYPHPLLAQNSNSNNNYPRSFSAFSAGVANAYNNSNNTNNSPMIVPDAVDSNETHSIDTVVDGVHALASAVHDLAHSASDTVQAIGARGEQTLTNFDSNFGAIQSDVQRVIQNANERVEQAVPMPALVTVGICLVVFLLLLALWLLISAIAERNRRSKRRSSDRKK